MNRREALKLSGTALASLFVSGLYQANTFSYFSSPSERKLASVSDTLWLNFNENNLGISPKVREAVERNLKYAFRYPDETIMSLQELLAKKNNLTSDYISLGSGSTDILRACLHLWIFKSIRENKKVQIITPAPSFFIVNDLAEGLKIPIKEIPLDSDFSMDIAKMEEAALNFDGVSICYLCNPNNPTATLTHSDKITPWIQRANSENTCFLVDEAYIDYITAPGFVSAKHMVSENKTNIIVARTFSKIYALAGLRVGYSISSPKVTKELTGFLISENMNMAGVVAATTALDDHEFIAKSKELTAQSKKLVEQTLQELNLKYMPSSANFIFHEIQGEVPTYRERMKASKIIVGRPFPVYENWNRVSIGLPEEMERFVSTLNEFRKKNWI